MGFVCHTSAAQSCAAQLLRRLFLAHGAQRTRERANTFVGRSSCIGKIVPEMMAVAWHALRVMCSLSPGLLIAEHVYTYAHMLDQTQPSTQKLCISRWG